MGLVVGVVTHEGPGDRKAKARAPGRACPGKGEEEAGGSRRKQAVRQLGSFVRALGLCRGSEVCCDHFGVAQQRDPAVSRGRVPCFPTFSLLAHIFPAVGLSVLCAGWQSCVCGKQEMLSPSPFHGRTVSALPCPLHSSGEKTLGAAPHASILLSPLCAHSALP